MIARLISDESIQDGDQLRVRTRGRARSKVLPHEGHCALPNEVEALAIIAPPHDHAPLVVPNILQLSGDLPDLRVLSSRKGLGL